MITSRHFADWISVAITKILVCHQSTIPQTIRRLQA